MGTTAPNKVGKTVYTVDAKTNEVTTWTCTGVIPGKDDIMCTLQRGTFQCVLPSRCVFLDKSYAELVVATNFFKQS